MSISHSNGRLRPNQQASLIDAAAISEALGFARPSSDGGWQCCCPLAREHSDNDRHPSFSISDTGDGRVLVHCFGRHEDEQDRLVAELKAKDLWPSSPSKKKVRRNHRWECVR
jgi:hypothetical protein